MTFLKNERESPSVNSRNIERLGDSVTKNETEITGIVSTTNLCIPPEVMTSPSNSSMIDNSPSVVKQTLEEANSEDMAHSTSDPSTVINHNIINLDIAAVQTSMVDQAQDSSTPAVDQTQLLGMESVKEHYYRHYLHDTHYGDVLHGSLQDCHYPRSR